MQREEVSDDAYAPLIDVIHEMTRDLNPDGVLVAWHVPGREPEILLAQGTCEPHASSVRAMIASAAAAAPAAEDDAARWQTLDDASTAMTTSIRTGRAVVIITALFRRIGDRTRMRAHDTARRMMPLIRAFFVLWSSRSGALSRIRGLTKAINTSDVATMMVNRRGQLIFANEAAEELIAEGDGLRCSGSLLSGSRFADTLRLQAAIEHVTRPDNPDASQDGKVAASSPVIALQRKDRRPLMATVIANGAATSDDESAATVHIFDPEQDLHALLEPVCKLYGLSPVETRLTCHLADGISLAEAAAQIRVREQTARSYLKQVFLKTGTNRQAELVWLMLKSSVRTARRCPTRFD